MACLEYVPTEWFDNTAPAINAANLNHIEIGIKSVTDCVNSSFDNYDQIIADLTTRLDQLEDRVAQLEIAPPPHTHPISDVINLQTELDSKPTGSWSRSGDTLNIDIAGS